MNRTDIEWCDFTVNPIRFRNLETGKVGHYCEKLSHGCKNCYASRMQTGPFLSSLEFVDGNKSKGELFFDESVLQQVLRRRKPATIFWCDMTDLFGEWVPDEWIDRCAAVCALTPHLRHLWLTKRARRMRGWAKAEERVNIFAHIDDIALDPDLPDSDVPTDPDWPFENLGLGVSVENRKHLDRIEELRQTPAALRFLSLEPLLEDLGTLDLAGIDQVIVGGESGLGARPMVPEWPRAIRDQCIAAGVPYFHKQNGEWSTVPTETVTNRTKYEDVPVGDGTHHRMFPVGKRAAGRLLDGRTWDQRPKGWG
jgi:protein gp37